MALASNPHLQGLQLNGIIQSAPTDIEKNEKFNGQEVDIHANKVSSNREVIQGSNSTSLQIYTLDYLCSYTLIQ